MEDFFQWNGVSCNFVGVPSTQPNYSLSRPTEICLSTSSKDCTYGHRQWNTEETIDIPYNVGVTEVCSSANQFYLPNLASHIGSRHHHLLGKAQIAQAWAQNVGVCSNVSSSSPSDTDVSYSSQFSQSFDASIDHVDSFENDMLELYLEQMPELLAELREQKETNVVLDDVTHTKFIVKELDTLASTNTPSTTYLENSRSSSFCEQYTPWNTPEQLSQATGQWMHNSTLTLPVKQPVFAIIRQPPKVHRARYEKEAEETAKGLLKNDNKEPVIIQLKNVVKGVGNITVTIKTVTIKGFSHPYIYPSCFGRGMPSDWKKDGKKRTVTIILKETEEYKKTLSFLGIKRNKLEGVDLRSHTKRELGYFCVKFETEVPSSSGNLTLVTSTTQSIQVLCPSTSTKRRRERKRQLQNSLMASM